MTRKAGNVFAIRVTGLETVVAALIAAGDEEWVEKTQQEWLQHTAKPAVIRSTPVATGTLKESTSDKVDDTGKGRYAAIVKQDAKTSVRTRFRKNGSGSYRGRIPYAQFVEMKPQRKGYMIRTAESLMPQYGRYLRVKLGNRLTKLGIGK